MLGLFMIPVMNVALVTGVGVVIPMALRVEEHRRYAWVGAGVSVLVGLVLPPGAWSALCVAPWLALTVEAGVRRLLAGARGDPEQLWDALVAGFAGTAALALVVSRLEVTLLGILEPIVKLTALHFTYAGAGTLALALRLHRARPSRWTWWARVLVFAAPPVVASGFVLRSAVGQVGGALLMTAGVWLVAALQLPDAREGPARWLWSVSCASPLVAMVLGVAWAAAQYWPEVPALTVPDMVPTHGALNAFGFVLCGHLANSLRRLPSPPRGGEGQGEG